MKKVSVRAHKGLAAAETITIVISDPELVLLFKALPVFERPFKLLLLGINRYQTNLSAMVLGLQNVNCTIACELLEVNARQKSESFRPDMVLLEVHSSLSETAALVREMEQASQGLRCVAMLPSGCGFDEFAMCSMGFYACVHEGMLPIKVFEVLNEVLRDRPSFHFEGLTNNASHALELWHTLSKREKVVALLIAGQKVQNLKLLSEVHFRSYHTLKTQNKNIHRKLKVHNHAELQNVLKLLKLM